MAGVDLPNQFPNSRMAQAVKRGQSRFMSVDGSYTPVAQQPNLLITNAAGTMLTVPPEANDAAGVTSAVIQAVGGPAYLTFDGSAPSATNYAVKIAQDAAATFGLQALASIKLFGTNASVAYYR